MFNFSSKSRLIELADQERSAIMRSGNFHRVAGPGIISLREDETIIRFHIEPVKHSFPLNGLEVCGVAINITVGLECAFDPDKALRGDVLGLQRVFEQHQRSNYAQPQNEVKRVLQNLIKRIMHCESLKNPTIGQKMRFLFYGSEERLLLLQMLRAELLRSLEYHGYILNKNSEITLSDLDLTPEIGSSLHRENIEKFIERHLPILGTEFQEELIHSILNTKAIDWQHILEQGDPDLMSKMPQERRRSSEKVADIPSTDPGSIALKKRHSLNQLSKADLSVLKQIPRIIS